MQSRKARAWRILPAAPTAAFPPFPPVHRPSLNACFELPWSVRQVVGEWPVLCRFLDAGNNETLRTLSEPASCSRPQLEKHNRST